MYRIIFIVLGIVIIGLGFAFVSVQKKEEVRVQRPQNNSPKVTIIARNLDTPWSIAFLPDKSTLVTERPGRVRLINEKGELEKIPALEHQLVREVGEGGLLGMALHPQFLSNNYVYLYYTYTGSNDSTFNRIVRMMYKNKQLTDEHIIVDSIPGAPNHNGGRIKFGPDNFLYIATGDAQNPSQAQDIKSLAGKILRVTDEGKPAPGNPFNNLVYSYGHRNVQGLAWDSVGQLWATEHGRSGIQSGLDEVNRIEKGKNYGWPIIQGDETQTGMETAVLNSGSTTWAPAGLAFFNTSLLFGGLRGQTLYSADTKNGLSLKEHFAGEFGRIRDVVIGPDNFLYITTSNNDGRGTLHEGDDKIIRIDPKQV